MVSNSKLVLESIFFRFLGLPFSVGVVELAVKDLERLLYCYFVVEIIHVDLESDVSERLWRRLYAVGCE